MKTGLRRRYDMMQTFCEAMIALCYAARVTMFVLLVMQPLPTRSVRAHAATRHAPAAERKVEPHSPPHVKV